MYGTVIDLLRGGAGCATIVKSPTQEVQIIGAKKGMKMSTRSKNYDLTAGLNMVIMDRSVEDIAVSLKCSPKAKSKTVYFKTRPSGWYLVGNFFSWQITGWLLDYVTEEGWNIQTPVNIGGYCSN